MPRLIPDKPMPLSPRISIYRWRSPMLASLAHRASGILLVLFALFLLCLLDAVYGSADQFFALQQWMSSPIAYVFLWFSGASLMYHICNGIRFMLLDIGIGESRKCMQRSAKISLIIGFLSLLVMAVWL